MSGLRTRSIIAIAEVVSAVIRAGKPLAALCGALLGAGIGATAGLITVYLLGFGILVGAIAGAMCGAALFKRPPRMLAVEDSPPSGGGPGQIVDHWTALVAEVPSIAVLMERSIYVAHEDKTPWSVVLDKLRRGEHPELRVDDYVPLASIKSLEVRGGTPAEVRVAFSAGGRRKATYLFFQTPEQRDDFLERLESALGVPLRREKRAWSRPRAALLPAILLGVGVLVAGGLACLSDNLIDHPRRPPRGKADLGGPFEFLIWAGPLRVALVGAIPCLAALAWLLKRMVRPPIEDTLIPDRTGELQDKTTARHERGTA